MKKISSFLLNFFAALLIGFLTFYQVTPQLASAAMPNNFVKTTVASNLMEPTDFAIAPDGRIFVSETGGAVRIIKDGQLLTQNFVTLPVLFTGDRGLLGITLDPLFSTNHFVYLFYTNSNPQEIRVSRFTESNDKAVLGSEKILLKSSQTLGTIHMGGGLQFGPDGKLWITIGDNSISTNAQDLSNIHGKLLRINRDGSIPTDNPFFGQSGKESAIWAYGLRNPFRFSFLPDGRPIIADVGGSMFEEINFGSKGGNYGWPNAEGVCTNCPYINPIYTYSNPPGAAVIGGFIYTGNTFPGEYRNSFIFGDYVRGFIKRLTFDSNMQVTGDPVFDDLAGTTISFKPGADGSIYYMTIFPGVLYKVNYNVGNKAPVAKINANPVSGKAPLKVNFSSQGSFDPENSRLKYKWDFGDGKTSKDANPSHKYNKKGVYKASLIVSDGKLESVPATIQILVGVSLPQAVITQPVAGTKYIAGQTFNFSGTATDAQDGDLSAKAFSWSIIMHHNNTHIHPFLGPINGVKSGQFTIPADDDDISAETWFEIQLTVTDSLGLTNTTSQQINPNKINLTFNSNTVGASFRIDGQLQALPLTMEAVVGFKRSVDVDSPQTIGSSTYNFESWSDNGAKSHEITTPGESKTYTISFQKSDSQPDVFNLAPGEVRQVSQNSVIAGDVKVAGQALYDNDGTTGLVILMEQSGLVEAPWGATVFSNPDRTSAENKLTVISDQMKQIGCGSSCQTVIKFHWPTDIPVSVQQTQPTGSVQSPSPSPSFSPAPSPSVNSTASPQPSPTPTPSPSSTPTPQPTAMPSSTPAPSNQPQANQQPSPNPTAGGSPNPNN